MTEFLIFLAMCGIFLLLFWWFLRSPSSEQRIKAQVAKELAEIRAKVRSDDLAQAQGFGRRENDSVQRFVPGPGAYPLDRYDGNPPDMPFGRDLNSADSRTIPGPFQGIWLEQNAEVDEPRRRLTIEPDRLTYHHALGMEPVVAVYFGGPDEVAIVTQQPENGKWTYAEYYFGLLEGGAKLTNLESMDVRWNRLSG
jgi:hypothetical protein